MAVFTENVSQPVLSRLNKLCLKAFQTAAQLFLSSLTSNVDTHEMLDQLFIPNLDAYDLVILLRRHQDLLQDDEADESKNSDRLKLQLAYKSVPVVNMNKNVLIAERIRRSLGHFVLVFTDILDPSFDSIALKFRKSDNAQVIEFLSSAMESVFEEIKVIVGENLLYKIDIRSDNFNLS